MLLKSLQNHLIEEEERMTKLEGKTIQEGFVSIFFKAAV